MLRLREFPPGKFPDSFIGTETLLNIMKNENSKAFRVIKI